MAFDCLSTQNVFSLKHPQFPTTNSVWYSILVCCSDRPAAVFDRTFLVRRRRSHGSTCHAHSWDDSFQTDSTLKGCTNSLPKLPNYTDSNEPALIQMQSPKPCGGATKTTSRQRLSHRPKSTRPTTRPPRPHTTPNRNTFWWFRFRHTDTAS